MCNYWFDTMERFKTNLPTAFKLLKIKPFTSDLDEVMKNQFSLSIHEEIKPLYRLAKYVHLWPFTYDKSNAIKPLSTTDKLKAYILIVAIVISFVWSVYIRIATIFKTQPTVSAVIDITFNFFAHLVVVLSIFQANSSYGNYSKKFFNELNYLINPITSQTFIFYDLGKTLQTQIMVVYAFGLGITGLDIWIGCETDYKLVLIYISLFIVRNLMLVVVLKILCKLEILMRHFRRLNDILRASAPSDNNCKLCVVKDDMLVVKYNPELIRKICKVHQQLCGLIDVTNKAHGCDLVFLYCAIVSLSINSLYFGVINGIPAASLDDGLNLAGLIFALEAFITTIFHCGLLVTLAGRCSSTRKSALQTGVIANEMLVNVGTEKITETEQLFKEQLNLLVQHISYRNPRFSAAGIFKVDCTMISIMMGAVTTYFIVILQFRGPTAPDK